MTKKKTGRPMPSKILVKPLDLLEKTDSGIVIVRENDFEKTNEAEVISIGTDLKGVKVGEAVIYQAMKGTPLEIDGVSHRILSENDVLLVMEENEKL